MRKRCGDDAALLHEALGMLQAMHDSTDFLEAPPQAEQPASPGRTGLQLGPWRLEHRIGRGGMGEVWLAARDDGRFEQQVAVKLLRH